MSALTLIAALHIAQACAGAVAPATLLPIAATESRFDPLAIHDNTTAREVQSVSPADATATATRLIAAGHNLDVGIAQINWPSNHLQRRGLSLAAAFDPCTSLRVGSEVLAECWQHADGTTQQTRLRAAIGCYNTGSTHRGSAYTALVLAAAVQIVPAIDLAGRDSPAPAPAPAQPDTEFAAGDWQDGTTVPVPPPPHPHSRDEALPAVLHASMIGDHP